MSDELASLRIRVESLEVDAADRKLKTLTQTANKTEKATDSLSASWVMWGKVAAAAAVAKVGYDLVNVTREFNRINAGLITATGSAEKAEEAFAAIQQFAATTPYDLAQVSNAFIKLTNLGLDPSEKALRSYGNTASAMGKSLNDFIEAVADASTGEMERLKEFGIRAQQEGDKVTFTFRGVATEVGRNSKEIEGYLRSLGEVEFAGAMDERAKTLDGALSNAADSYDGLLLALSKQGPESFMTELAFDITSALDNATLFVQKNGLQVAFNVISAAVSGTGEDISNLATLLTKLAQTNNVSMKSVGESWIDFQTLVKVATVEVSSFVDSLTRVYQAQKLIDQSKEALAAGNLDKAIDLQMQANELAKAGTDAREASIDAILAEGDAHKENYKKATEELDSFMVNWRKSIEERKNAPNEGDKLAQFYKGGEGKGSFGKGAKSDEEKAADKARKDAIRDEERRLDQIKDTISGLRQDLNEFGKTEAEIIRSRLEALNAKPAEIAEAIRLAGQMALEQLTQDLMTEEEVMRQSYERRREIILANTQAGSPQQGNLLAKNDQRFTSDILSGGWETGPTFESEMEVLNAEYEAKRLAAEGHQETMFQLENMYAQKKLDIQTRYVQTYLAMGQSIADGMAGVMAGVYGEQSKQARAAFAVAKAFQIAQAMMSAYKMANDAAASQMGIPYAGPALGAAAAAGALAMGLANVASIKSQNFSGAYDAGGSIPPGSIGLVGERGAELVSGSANVLGRKQTSQLLEQAANGGSEKPQVKVAVFVMYNQSDIIESMKNSDEFDEVVITSLGRNQSAAKEAMG